MNFRRTQIKNMIPEDSIDLLYPRSTNPYNKPWEDWAAMWCNWLLSISRNKNPASDQTGENCDQEQNDPHVWFLGGSFGNDDVIKRKCVIPYGRAIFFPILEKEDSFVEDSDLTTEEQLAQRAEHFMDRVTRLEASIDNVSLKDLRNYRVRSRFFNLTFPQNGVYDVAAGITRSVCDGYWIFLKPLSREKHYLHFAGECVLPSGEVVTENIKKDSIYLPFRQFIENNQKFKVEVIYELIIQ